jgi:3-deoxy-7-phosphoheptulonate synthase
MASGLSMPVGFKNTTSGAVQPAINAIQAAVQPQTFLGIDESGRASVVATTGNPDCHVILRGGDASPNHTAAHVASALAALAKAGLPAKLMVDASHANCAKDCERMPATFREILAQRTSNSGVVGAMLESNLVAGAQSLGKDRSTLTYGQSITDQCIDWETTETLVREAAAVAQV